MKKSKKRSTFTLEEVIIITIAISSIVGITVGLFFYYRNNKNLVLDKEALDIIDTYNAITKNYYGDVDKEQISKGAINGMLSELNERYSLYLDDINSNALNDKLDGSYKGIGVQVIKKDNKISVYKVYDNTPASEAGLKEQDILIKVDDYVIKEDDELSYVSSLIKQNKKVNLTIKRNNKEKVITIDVKTIETPVVDYKVFTKDGKKIGYIYLASFSKTSADQVKRALTHIEDEGIDSLIFDVRSNTGGYLEVAEEILNIFVKKGKKLYSIEYNDNKKVSVKDTTDEHRNYDMVVLINGISASASELLASSLKENNGAILVGTKSFGKGLVQNMSSLSDNTLIKYTAAKWYTPSGEFINEKGITPSIEVYLSDKYAKNPSDETDEQLQKAIEILTK